MYDFSIFIKLYLKKLGNKINKINSNLKRIRSIERLTAEELDAIRELDLEEGSLIWHCRNEFLLSFNFMGMRVKDVLLLKYSHINRGQLQYQMHKSKDLVSISLSEEALEIIGWYEKRKKPEAIYILPFFTDRKNEPLAKELESATALINKYLKKIAKMAGINKKVSTHVARHSWAQAAKTANVDIRVIQKGLGHEDVRTTEIYLNGMTDHEVNDANLMITRRKTPPMEDKKENENGLS